MTQAAAIAFYTGLSIAPLLTIAVWIAQHTLGGDAKDRIIGAFSDVMGKTASAPIQQLLHPPTTTAENNLTLAGIISIVLLLFSATGVLAQMQSALNTIWEVEQDASSGIWSFIRKRILSFGMLITMLFLLLVSGVVSTAIQGFMGSGGDQEKGILAEIVQNAISFGVFTVLFAAMFKYLPDAKLRWHDVWMGALISAALFTAGKFGLGVYLGRSDYENSMGASIGSFVAMLVWVYYSATIVLIGAEGTQVYARRHGTLPRPEEHAKKVVVEKHTEPA
jgi:membrane protein